MHTFDPTFFLSLFFCFNTCCYNALKRFFKQSPFPGENFLPKETFWQGYWLTSFHKVNNMLGENVVELKNLAQNWNKDKMLSELGAGSHMLLFWRWVTFLAVRLLRILASPMDFRQRQVFTMVERQACLLPPVWHMNLKVVWQDIWFIKPNLWRGRTSLTGIWFPLFLWKPVILLQVSENWEDLVYWFISFSKGFNLWSTWIGISFL